MAAVLAVPVNAAAADAHRHNMPNIRLAQDRIPLREPPLRPPPREPPLREPPPEL